MRGNLALSFFTFSLWLKNFVIMMNEQSLSKVVAVLFYDNTR
jgi:hypothetical protein